MAHRPPGLIDLVGDANEDQTRSVTEAFAFRSCTSCAIDRGLAIGAQRARITFPPFRAFDASATIATSAGPPAP